MCLYIRILLHIHPTFLHLLTAATISMYYIRLLMILSRTHITINDEIITAIGTVTSDAILTVVNDGYPVAIWSISELVSAWKKPL